MKLLPPLDEASGWKMCEGVGLSSLLRKVQIFGRNLCLYFLILETKYQPHVADSIEVFD